MAEKLLKTKKRKIVPSGTGRARTPTASDLSPAGRGRSPVSAEAKPSSRSESLEQCAPNGRAASMRPPRKVVLVGTYKEKQLAWIKKNGVYNYPVKEGDEFDAESFAKIKELWLYADSKGRRRCFTAEFVGKMSRQEFLASYPTYANLGRGRSPSAPNGRAASMKPPCEKNSKLSVLAKSENREYYVFKTTFLDYGPKLDAPDVLIRVMDFATGRGRTKSVKKAYDQYKADGEFAPLAHYLPTELSQVPREHLRVCEAAVQLDFFPIMGDCVSKSVPFPPLQKPKFTFIDLFAGIGGFHLAMHKLGGKCVFACEWDKDAQKTYAENYGIVPEGDITKINERDIPPHDVLCAGFPCQAFSKAGKQLGFADETKGTLFFDVERILKFHKSKYFILENVRNLVAHDNGNTWRTIHDHLVQLGYRLTPNPLIVSPHYFGIPQLRERVVVLGVYDPKNAHLPLEIKLPKARSKDECSLDAILEKDNHDPRYQLTDGEIEIINTWDEFYKGIEEKVIGFPIWVDWFKTPPPEPGKMPEWKRSFVLKNNRLYQNNKAFIDGWLTRHNNLEGFTPTMRKMEWQCGTSVSSAWGAFFDFGLTAA